MKIIILSLILFLSIPAVSFAQNNMEAMRWLTVNALTQYGQRLYDRGDYNEASAVFNHVLTYDDHQSQALEYLKKMGNAPVLNPSPSILPRVEKFNIPRIKMIGITDNASLQQAIEIKKQELKKLQNQIMWMKANIASLSTE